MTMSVRRISIAFILVVAALGGDHARAAEELAGPVSGAVLRVIDGDSMEVKARLWLGLDLTVQVRVRGIDTPEVRSDCAEERVMAAAARGRLVEIAGPTVMLFNIRDDKYAGRVDADVSGANGVDVRTAMLASGVARPYDGGQRGSWCDAAEITGSTEVN